MVKLSDAEFEVMKVIWEKNEATSLEIIEKLKDKNWKDTTIRTLINRLLKKGAISVSKENKRKYIFFAVINENEYKKEATKNLVKKFYNNSISDLITEYSSKSNIKIDDINEIIKKEIKHKK